MAKKKKQKKRELEKRNRGTIPVYAMWIGPLNFKKFRSFQLFYIRILSYYIDININLPAYPAHFRSQIIDFFLTGLVKLYVVNPVRTS